MPAPQCQEESFCPRYRPFAPLCADIFRCTVFIDNFCEFFVGNSASACDVMTCSSLFRIYFAILAVHFGYVGIFEINIWKLCLRKLSMTYLRTSVYIMPFNKIPNEDPFQIIFSSSHHVGGLTQRFWWLSYVIERHP